MYSIPPDLRFRFDALLSEKEIPKNFRYHYKKWLQYYPDFCRKYHFPESESGSLHHFINKLREKNQTEAQQNQACHAVSFYYELLMADRGKSDIKTETSVNTARTEIHPESVCSKRTETHPKRAHSDMNRATRGNPNMGKPVQPDMNRKLHSDRRSPVKTEKSVQPDMNRNLHADRRSPVKKEKSVQTDMNRENRRLVRTETYPNRVKPAHPGMNKKSQAGRRVSVRTNGKETRAGGQRAAKRQEVHIDKWKLQYAALDNEIKLRHYSPKTLEVYSRWIRRFQHFTRSKDPVLLSDPDVKAFLTFLAVEQQVSASSQNQAFNALLFFFRHILKNEFGKIKDIPRAKKRPYIPVVLSREEVHAVISHLSYPYDLVAKLLYGCGLRLSECLNLRIHYFNFDHRILTVHDGKGKKDRTLPLPETILQELKNHLESVRDLHQKDLDEGYAGVFLFDLLEKKYKNAAKELIWQWFFPGKKLTYVKETKEYRRYHLHERHVQKAIKTAVHRAGILKRATSHTFRHSFASHLLQANYDIRTIQELLGHSDVKTTMIYTHTVRSMTVKEAKSPLDLP